MPGEPRYSSSIKVMPYLYLETRKAAKLLLGGETSESIASLSAGENIFQLEKEKRRLELARKVTLRLGAVSHSVIELIASGQDENARLGVFYAIIKTDLLFFEFMREVYSDKAHIGQTLISDSDISEFLACKANENECMRKWSAGNLAKVKNTYKKILREAGLAEPDGADLRITKPIMNDELKKAWDKPDPYTAAFCLEA